MAVKWEFSAGGVVYKKEGDKIYILLIKNKDRYGFPKGNIERTEKKEDAALREVKEETGVDVNIKDYLGNVEYWYRSGTDTIHKFVYYYLMEYKGGEVKPQKEEIDSAEFVELEKVNELLSFDKDKKVFELAVKKLTDAPKSN
ncbi:MAG: NUDIX hydrolase [Hydrogenothermaceae bacterium]